MRKVLFAITCFAPTADPIIILGQRGSGKTWMAERIHEASGRPGRFIERSMPTIQKDMEAVTFTGHARGSFTGAHEDRAGLLEQAHGGTLFLDEFGLATDEVQRVLLRFLEKRSVERFGESRERTIDVRLVVATNEDLDARVAQGTFRADLHDRLGYMVLRIPPLAERREEILPLAYEFLAAAAEDWKLRTRPTMRARPTMSDALKKFLVSAPWPGNVRQLRLVLRTALAFASLGRSSTQVDLEDLPPEFVARLGERPREAYLDAVDRGQQAREALARSRGRKSDAARHLGISRTTIYRWLKA